jgi:hypothetical protein
MSFCPEQTLKVIENIKNIGGTQTTLMPLFIIPLTEVIHQIKCFKNQI